jgi:hypothetical protein
MTHNCLIGYTGFVGTNILLNNNINFDEFYNSKNIKYMQNNYNIIYFAGLSGTQWYANKFHEKDLENVNFFIEKLKNVKCNKFILISTINVYPCLNEQKNECDILQIENTIDYYGKHRLIFEKFVMDTYSDYNIIRLPCIFGKNMKKGVLYDLLNENNLNNLCLNDEYQFYDLKNINNDIEYCINNKINIINLFPEPIKVYDLINNCFKNIEIIDNYTIKYNDKYVNLLQRNAKKLDNYTKYSNTNYLYDSNQSIKNIKNYINLYNNVNERILLVIPLYKIKQHLFETNHNNNLYEIYSEMSNITINSYLKHNNDIFELRIIGNDIEQDNYGDMFKDISQTLLNIHFVEKRTLLFVESDTICINKLTFNNINKLLMFNICVGSCDLYSCDKMMNSGVIYIPKDCMIDYEFAFNHFNNINFYEWISFQKYWNIIYYNQFISFDESIEYNKNIGKYNFFRTNYCPNDFIKHLRSKDFFDDSQPSIIHLCSSRGAYDTLEIMKKIKDNDVKDIYNLLRIL